MKSIAQWGLIFLFGFIELPFADSSHTEYCQCPFEEICLSEKIGSKKSQTRSSEETRDEFAEKKKLESFLKRILRNQSEELKQFGQWLKTEGIKSNGWRQFDFESSQLSFQLWIRREERNLDIHIGTLQINEIKMGENPKGINFAFSQFFVALVSGLTEIVETDSSLTSIRIRGLKVVNQQLAKMLNSLGFKKLGLRDHFSNNSRAVFKLGTQMAGLFLYTLSILTMNSSFIQNNPSDALAGTTLLLSLQIPITFAVVRGTLDKWAAEWELKLTVRRPSFPSANRSAGSFARQFIE